MLTPFLHLPHQLRMARPLDVLLFGLVVDFGIEVVAALAFGLLLLDGDAVALGSRVTADAGHLPGDFHIRRAGPDGEAVAFDLLGDHRLGERADDGQLIAEV